MVVLPTAASIMLESGFLSLFGVISEFEMLRLMIHAQVKQISHIRALLAHTRLPPSWYTWHAGQF